MTLKHFNIGDKVWLACCGTKEKRNPCPICAGKLKVTLILGTGEQCVLDCDYCAKGYERPNSFELEWEPYIKPEFVTVSSFETDGKNFNYRFEEGFYAEQDKVFNNREEAEAKCKEIAAELAAQEQKRLEWAKENSKKKYSWNAGYHKREAKRHEKQMNYHKTKAHFMGIRAKENEKTAESRVERSENS